MYTHRIRTNDKMYAVVITVTTAVWRKRINKPHTKHRWRPETKVHVIATEHTPHTQTAFYAAWLGSISVAVSIRQTWLHSAVHFLNVYVRECVFLLIIFQTNIIIIPQNLICTLLPLLRIQKHHWRCTSLTLVTTQKDAVRWAPENECGANQKFDRLCARAVNVRTQRHHATAYHTYIHILCIVYMLPTYPSPYEREDGLIIFSVWFMGCRRLAEACFFFVCVACACSLWSTIQTTQATI